MIAYSLCFYCAVFSGWTVRQMISHAVMLGGTQVCGHAS